jgi:hypothetical protein
MSRPPEKPNKMHRLKRIHTGTEWMFSDTLYQILKESVFEVKASGVRTPKDLMNMMFHRAVFPTLKKGEELIPQVMGLVGNKLVVVNYEKYMVVQQDRAFDTLMGVFLNRGASMVGILVFDKIDSLVIAMVMDLKNKDMLTRAVKVVWKEVASGGKVADQFLEQSLPENKVAEVLSAFGWTFGFLNGERTNN